MTGPQRPSGTPAHNTPMFSNNIPVINYITRDNTNNDTNCNPRFVMLSGGHKQPKQPGSRKRAFLHGSHHHVFLDNWHTVEERMIGTNLPWAQRLDPEPGDIYGLLDLAENLFRIKGLGRIGIPEWAAKW